MKQNDVLVFNGNETHFSLEELSPTHYTAPARFQSENTPAEKRMQPPPYQLWCMTQRAADWDGVQYWNITFLVEVLRRLNYTVSKTVVAELLKHHEALRLRIKQDTSGYYYLFAPSDKAIPFSYVDLSAVPEETQQQAVETAAQEYQVSLNLVKGPVIRIVLFDLGPTKSQRLLVIISHTVCDEFSTQLLLSDFITLYAQISKGQSPQLPPTTTSLKNLVEKKWEYSQSENFQGELAYWQSLPWERVRPLPIDFPEKMGLNTRASVRKVSVLLTMEETAILVQKLPNIVQVNVLGILLTAFVKMLAQWTGSNTHAFFLVHNGRLTPFSAIDLSRTVGNLIAVPQIVLDIEDTATLMEALEKIKEQLYRVPHHGIMWEWLPLSMTLKSDLAFNYVGQTGKSDDISSLWFRPAPESTGPAEDPQQEQWTLLGFTALIRDNQLEISLSYSYHLFHRKTIESLIDEYIMILRKFTSVASFLD